MHGRDVFLCGQILFLRHGILFLCRTVFRLSRCLAVFFLCLSLRFRQPVVRLYGRTLSAFRTEKILVLYFSGSQYAVFFEKFRIENAVLHRKGQDAVNVLGTLLVETGGEVFVEKVVGVDVVTLTGIDIRQCAYQDGESTVSFALHDTAHNAVVYEVCTHGEVVQSPFFDSCHVLVCGQI